MRLQPALALVSVLAATQPAAAVWKLESKKDAMTDRVEKTAIVRTAEGHELRVYADRRGEFFAELRIPESSPEAALPALIVRVDDHDPVLLPAETFYPRRVIVRLDDPDEKAQGLEPDRELLAGVGRQMMDGSRVVVRIVAKDETEHDAAFSLSGARAAIAGALSVPTTLTEEQQATALARAMARTMGKLALKACEFDADRPLCELNHAGCKDNHRGDSHALLQCFQDLGEE